MRSQNKETRKPKRNQHIQKKRKEEKKNECIFLYFVKVFHFRGRNFRVYSPSPDYGVVVVGVFLFPLVRPFLGGV